MKSLRLSQQSILALVRFDHRNLWFAVGRVSLALATLSEVIFTSPRALFVPVGGVEGPYCRLGEYHSIYCLGSPDSHLEFKRIAVAAILGVVVSGYRPRYLALPHLWATYSVSTSITLPDGGDSIALICLILLTPLCLIDPRRWIWNAPGHRMSLDCRAIGLASQWALRIQFAFIYADSALTKVGVADWANGSAFYYFVRDKMFGTTGPLSPFFYWSSATPLGSVAATWGTIAIELVIALFIMGGPRLRRISLYSTVALHLAIYVTLGLFSFSLVMIAGAVLVANTDRVQPLGMFHAKPAGVLVRRWRLRDLQLQRAGSRTQERKVREL